ncbi:hypothetical protein ALC60_07187 [Trachymyrmex zeteki]|uniref:DUF4817 domain-containing protein n=1 Tax=Mycetomoellerius zeteki TaxID=64791 RepID=A0A151X171_9HYME|nr:hypothetical protein ALC60_07187 [Trachymyrmex zeteki]
MRTEQERISLLMMRRWGDRRKSYAHVTKLFNRTFRNEDNGISKSTVIRTVQRFEEMGFIKDRNRQGRPAIATNDWAGILNEAINLNDLRQRIINEFRIMSREFCRNAVVSFYNRLAHCQTAEERQFEYLL